MSYDSSRVELIGPIDVAWNTAGIEAGYVALADLPAGSDVIRAWCEFTTAWNTGTSAALSLGIAEASDLTTVGVLVAYDAKTIVAPNAAARVEAVATTAGRGGSALVAGKLAVHVAAVGTATSAGAGKVFALVVTPDASE